MEYDLSKLEKNLGRCINALRTITIAGWVEILSLLLMIAMTLFGMLFVANGFSWDLPDQAAMRELAASEGVILHEQPDYPRNKVFTICDGSNRISNLTVVPFRGKIYLESKETWPGVTCHIDSR